MDGIEKVRTENQIERTTKVLEQNVCVHCTVGVIGENKNGSLNTHQRTKMHLFAKQLFFLSAYFWTFAKCQ